MACCNRNRAVLPVSAAAALILGLFIYIRFRPDTYLSRWIGPLLGGGPLSPAAAEALPRWLSLFLRGFACDMLWAYALTVVIFLLLGREALAETMVICSLFETALECLQLTRLVPGTFDVLDILSELAVSALTMLAIKRNEGQL